MCAAAGSPWKKGPATFNRLQAGVTVCQVLGCPTFPYFRHGKIGFLHLASGQECATFSYIKYGKVEYGPSPRRRDNGCVRQTALLEREHRVVVSVPCRWAVIDRRLLDCDAHVPVQQAR